MGSPPTHLHSAEKACFVGALTPLKNPQHYLDSIFNLWNQVREKYSSIPIVINTQGWIKGLGKELLTDIYTGLQPTFIVNIKSEELGFEEGEDIEYEKKVKPTIFNCSPLSLQLRFVFFDLKKPKYSV